MCSCDFKVVASREVFSFNPGELSVFLCLSTFSNQFLSCFLVSHLHVSPCSDPGIHLQAECPHPTEGAAHAPQQHPGRGGHGDPGGPPRRRHHAQPVPALPAETHLRESQHVSDDFNCRCVFSVLLTLMVFVLFLWYDVIKEEAT